jgi:hypothetical protein
MIGPPPEKSENALNEVLCVHAQEPQEAMNTADKYPKGLSQEEKTTDQTIHHRRSKGIKKEQFGSTAARANINCHIETPYVQPTNNYTPGPGMYLNRDKPSAPSSISSSFLSSKANFTLTSSKTKTSDLYSQDVHNSTTNVAFQAVSERPCLAKTKANNPLVRVILCQGPIIYIYIWRTSNDRSHAHRLSR